MEQKSRLSIRKPQLQSSPTGHTRNIYPPKSSISVPNARIINKNGSTTGSGSGRGVGSKSDFSRGAEPKPQPKPQPLPFPLIASQPPPYPSPSQLWRQEQAGLPTQSHTSHASRTTNNTSNLIPPTPHSFQQQQQIMIQSQHQPAPPSLHSPPHSLHHYQSNPPSSFLSPQPFPHSNLPFNPSQNINHNARLPPPSSSLPNYHPHHHNNNNNNNGPPIVLPTKHIRRLKFAVEQRDKALRLQRMKDITRRNYQTKRTQLATAVRQLQATAEALSSHDDTASLLSRDSQKQFTTILENLVKEAQAATEYESHIGEAERALDAIEIELRGCDKDLLLTEKYLLAAQQVNSIPGPSAPLYQMQMQMPPASSGSSLNAVPPFNHFQKFPILSNPPESLASYQTPLHGLAPSTSNLQSGTPFQYTSFLSHVHLNAHSEQDDEDADSDSESNSSASSASAPSISQMPPIVREYYDHFGNLTLARDQMYNLETEHIADIYLREDQVAQGQKPSTTDDQFLQAYLVQRNAINQKHTQAKEAVERLYRECKRLGHSIEEPPSAQPLRQRLDYATAAAAGAARLNTVALASLAVASPTPSELGLASPELEDRRVRAWRVDVLISRPVPPEFDVPEQGQQEESHGEKDPLTKLTSEHDKEANVPSTSGATSSRKPSVGSKRNSSKVVESKTTGEYANSDVALADESKDDSVKEEDEGYEEDHGAPTVNTYRTTFTKVSLPGFQPDQAPRRRYSTPDVLTWQAMANRRDGEKRLQRVRRKLFEFI